jgi:hypothetical protein
LIELHELRAARGRQKFATEAFSIG